nr:zinc finger, RING/FYVE/PHD-type [Tanacetum cinerariifolium]
RLDVVKSPIAYKPKPRASIYAFILEMKGYFDILESLSMVFDAELSINTIISGLPVDYNQFMLSYQMNGKETSIIDFIASLKGAEQFTPRFQKKAIERRIWINLILGQETYMMILLISKGDKTQKSMLKRPTRRFLLNKLGMIEFLKLEIARRNFALKKWYDAKKRLAEVLGRKNKAMKRRTYLLDKMRGLEQQGGSLCQADALGTLANEYLRRAKAYEGRAKALRQRAKAYNQRVDAMDPRVDYFADRCDNIAKLG